MSHDPKNIKPERATQRVKNLALRIIHLVPDGYSVTEVCAAFLLAHKSLLDEIEERTGMKVYFLPGNPNEGS